MSLNIPLVTDYTKRQGNEIAASKMLVIDDYLYALIW